MGGVEAFFKARQLRREGAPGASRIRAKKCKHCQGWYFTTKPRWRK